jgi:tight adherence protein C
VTAALAALGVFLAVLGVRRRRVPLDPFLAPTPAGPAPRRRVIRLPAGALSGAVIGVLAAVGSGAGPVPMVAVGGVTGAAMERATRAVRDRRRARRLVLELPTVADTLALHVLAGDSVSTALHRFVDTGSGVAVDELRRALQAEHGGLESALRDTARQSAGAEAARLFDLLAYAHRTGGRLASALTALADDYRGAIAADLTAEGGRRAIAVYGPILALMVPITLVFLMYPTLAGLKALATP